MSRSNRAVLDRGTLILGGTVLVIVVAFYWQRSRSSVLYIERQDAVVRTIAEDTGLSKARVMALWESVGVAVTADQLAGRARRFAADRTRFGGSGLAVLPQIDLASMAESLWTAANGDAEAARAAVLRGPQAWRVRRFEHMVERFETRLAAGR